MLLSSPLPPPNPIIATMKTRSGNNNNSDDDNGNSSNNKNHAALAAALSKRQQLEDNVPPAHRQPSTPSSSGRRPYQGPDLSPGGDNPLALSNKRDSTKSQQPQLDRPPTKTKRQNENNDDDDPHNLVERFVMNQQLMFRQALAEIRQGEKRSCWMWFILPAGPYVVNGMERGSSMNRHFALRGDDAVRAYLSYDGMNVNLRDNYLEISSAILRQIQHGNTLNFLLGPLDRDKAISSFRLFERVSREMGDEELADVCAEILRLVVGPVKKKKSLFGVVKD